MVAHGPSSESHRGGDAVGAGGAGIGLGRRDRRHGGLGQGGAKPDRRHDQPAVSEQYVFGVGPDEKAANVLNIQPVYPTSIGDWTIITRTIVPMIYVPDLTAGLPELPSQDREKSEFGLGDINFSAYLSPATSGVLIWGIGPSITFDSATSRELGSGKYSAGPAAVVVWTPKPWVVGTLVRQLWSFAGNSDRNSVSQFLIQPFVNYNFGEG